MKNEYIFEKKVLHQIFGTNKDQITSLWERWTNLEVGNRRREADIVATMKSKSWAGQVWQVRENNLRCLKKDSRRKETTGTPKRKKWVNKVKNDLHIIL